MSLSIAKANQIANMILPERKCVMKFIIELIIGHIANMV